MMEKVELSDYKPRWTKEEIKEKWGGWATIGKTADREKEYHNLTGTGFCKNGGQQPAFPEEIQKNGGRRSTVRNDCLRRC